MKTQIGTFLILILFVLPFSSYSQTEIGLTLGSNFSGLSNSNLKSSPGLGYMAGVYARLHTQGKIIPQAELRYSYESLEQNLSFAISKLNTHMLRLPLSLVYAILPKVNLHAGPDFGITLNSNQEILELKDVVPTSYKFPTQERINVGISMGLNVELGKASRLGLRYYHGLNKAFPFNRFLGTNYQLGAYFSTRLFAIGGQ